MRILQVISYGYQAGGAEKSVVLLKKHLRRRGHEVMIITSDHNGDKPAKHFSDAEFPEIDNQSARLATKAIQHLWYRPSHQAIKLAVAQFKPDIVHFHVMGQLSPSVLFAIGSVPGVLTVHGPEEYVANILEWGFPKHLFKDDRVDISNLTTLGLGYYLYFRYLQRPIYMYGFRKHLRALIAPSQYMANVLKAERHKVPIHHVYNGIELPEYQDLPRKRRLLYVGRLEHVKGVDVLLKAMVPVVAKLPDVHVSIVGDGAARPQLEAFVAKHKLARHVTFHGWLKGAAVNSQYANATAVVIPSVWPENLPTVCIEALATGRPVIGTRSGGIPELIRDGVTGQTVEAGNSDDLAAAIINLLSRDDLTDMATACSTSMQDFKVLTFIRRLERLYRQTVNTSLEET